MNKNLEIRSFDTSFSQNDEKVITGRGVVFDSLSNDLGGFREIIKPTAITQELIDNSDVYARMNHSNDYILARSNKGVGSLKLELKSDGLYYSFEAPHTEKGNELVQHIRRGEISQSSFAFMVAQEEDAERWYKNEEGVIIREINKISYLGDVAPVFQPAYSETSVSLRALDMVKEMNQPIEEREDKKEDEEEEVKTDSEVKEDEVKEEESGKTESNTEEKEEKEDSEEKNITKEEDFEEKRQLQDIYNKENKGNIKTIKSMEFKLLSAINAIANNQVLDETSSAVIEKGKEEMRKAGLSYGGQIQLPMEVRSAITVASEGEDVVATNIYDILEPLRAKNVLAQAGAKFLTGLVGDVQVPIMAGGNVTWEGETAEASDAGISYSSVKLSPKRLTAFVDVSKKFLIQTSDSAEALIRQDLINAINSKLESTLLGSASGNTTQPAGIFYGKDLNKISGFTGVCELEADIEDANVIGECKYIMSNKAKAKFRAMPKSSKSTELVMQNGNIDGTPVLNTSNVGGQDVVYGDWSNFAIGQFGGIDITVDPFTKAKDGQVRLVVNAYFDGKALRPGAFAVGTTDSTATGY